MPAKKCDRDSLVDWLACPQCRGPLEVSGSFLRCPADRAAFPIALDGSVDLRPVAELEFATVHHLPWDPAAFALTQLDMLTRCDGPVQRIDALRPTNVSAALFDRFPQADAPGVPALDLGCGGGACREALERLGFTWVGLDRDSRAATVLGDAHALPFRDASFSFVLSLSMLQYTFDPYRVCEEIARVLQDDGLLICTASMQFDRDAYFYFTPASLVGALSHAGFAVSVVAPDPFWTSLTAVLKTGLFPGLPLWAARAAAAPLEGLSGLMWRLSAHRRSRGTSRARLLSKRTGEYSVIARRPPRACSAAGAS
jgi:SAM-dependent methyltransferase